MLLEEVLIFLPTWTRVNLASFTANLGRLRWSSQQESNMMINDHRSVSWHLAVYFDELEQRLLCSESAGEREVLAK